MKKLTFLILLLLSNMINAQQDCSTALSICGNSNINYSPIGFGTINESLGGCLATGGENNSVWYKFQINTSGTLTFVISPSAAVDYDWAVYGPNVSCDNKGLPIRCNAAGTYGNTGLNMTSTNTVGAPGSNVPFCRYMDVVAGETYYLLIDNWVGLGFNGIAPFSLSWGGTATLKDPFLSSTITPNPFISPGVVTSTPGAPSEIYLCDKNSVFDFTTLSAGILNGNQNFSVSYHTTSNDALSGLAPITTPTSVSTSNNYYYSISYQDPAGGTVACRQTGAFKFVDKSIDVAITTTSTNLCPGDTVTLTSNIATGNTWSTGATTNSITITTGGTYTLTNTNGFCFNTATITINSTSDPNIQISGDLTFCDGASTKLSATATGSGLSYLWSTGANTQDIIVSTPGTYTVEVTTLNLCKFSKSVVVTKNDLASVQNSSINICRETNFGIFDLTSIQANITSVSGVVFKFYENLSDAQIESSNFITNVTSYSSGNATLYVLVKSGNCVKIATLTLSVTLIPKINVESSDKTVCVGESISFAVDAVNGIGYQWQEDSGSGFADLVDNSTFSGVTTSTLNLTGVTTNMDGNKYRLIIKSACLPNIISNTYLLSVPELIVTKNFQNVTCFSSANGSASVVVSGGNLPYTYSWSTGATSSSINNLNVGSYTVLVTDANGCKKSESFVISQPAELVNSNTVTNISCSGLNNGDVKITTTGGVQPYTYLWLHNNATTSSLNGLSPGNYTVQVRDANNCEKMEQIIISEPTMLTATINFKDVYCFGTNSGEATVTPLGGTPPYQYTWSNGALTNVNTNLKKGIYSVVIVDANGCTVTKSVSITEPSQLEVVTLQTKAGCNGATTDAVMATVSGGTAPYSYKWSNGVSSSTVNNLPTGNHVLVVTDAKGCTKTVNVTVSASTNMLLGVNTTNASCAGQSNGTASVVVTGGKAPYSYKWSTGASASSINNLTAGNYSVTVIDGFGCTITELFSITEPSALAITHQQVNVNCYAVADGSISLSVLGGSPPYTYHWSNGFKTSSLNQIPAGTYTVVVTDNNKCTISHTVTISQPNDVAIPSAVNQTFCINENATVGDLVIFGTNIKWYNVPVNGTPLNPSDVLTTGSYYASQTINGCESFARVGISVTITNTSIPTGFSNQEFCEPTIPTIADLNVNGSNVKWYDLPIGGNVLASSTVLVNGNTYYASQTTNNCESSRFAVRVNIYPNKQLVTGHLMICDVATIKDISIDGYPYTQLKWYSNLTSTVPLSSSQILTSGIYYVSTFNFNLCESPKKAIQIVVSNSVAIPTTNPLQTFCNSATINDLVVTGTHGAKINWYNSTQSTTPLSSNTVLLSGTYYVEQEMTPCKSPRIPVAVRVIPSTAPVMTDFTLCDGATVADLYIAGSGNTKYVWYLDAIGTTPLPDTHVLSSGFYYVAIESYGCVSNRKSVYVTVNQRPSSPTGRLIQNFNYQAKVSNLIMDQTNIVWYRSYFDAINKINPLNTAHVLVGGETYYAVIVDANNCNSYPTAVQVNIVLGMNDLNIEHLKYYPNPVEHELVISYIEDIENIEIYDVTSKRVFKQKYQDKLVKIPFATFSSGTYLTKVVTANGSQFIKIIKK